MLSMRVDTLINSLVRQELEGKGRQDEALYFQLDLHMAVYHNSEQQYQQRRGLHLLYYVQPRMTYITVFSAVSPSVVSRFTPGGIRALEWKHETTHDSCWSNINAFSETYFDMAEKINELLVADGLPQEAPINMSEHHFFPAFGHVFNWIPVKVTKDPTDTHNYRKLVEFP